MIVHGRGERGNNGQARDRNYRFGKTEPPQTPRFYRKLVNWLPPAARQIFIMAVRACLDALLAIRSLTRGWIRGLERS